jgi:hypothetical protein
MTVSGLGPARTPRSPITPTHRTPRSPTTPTHRTPRAEKPAAGTDAEHLTPADRELILEVTGQRVGPGQPATTGFAAALAAERAAGRLAIGQEVTAVFLKDLNRRYERASGPNPLAVHLDKAVGVLTRSGSPRIDVSA